MMPYSIGVDLGASLTAVAIADEYGVHAAHLSPLLVTPSAVYISPDGTLITGDAALRAGEADPARLVRGFKKRLGDPTPLIVEGAQFSPEQLMAAQLREVVDEVAEQRGQRPQSIVLTHPVTWGPYRTEHFARIAELSGLEVRASITEPVAAATHLDAQGNISAGDIVAIVDFGSDSVTATLLRKGAAGFEILGTPEDTDHVGSIDFDDAVRTLLDQKLGGRISALDPSNASDAAVRVAIDNTCVAAKETLSIRKEAIVTVDLPDGSHRLSVTRDELSQLLRPSVRLAVAALRRTIGSAEIEESSITDIVLAGGVSRLPLIAEELAEMGRPVRAIHHPKLTVALGAAHIARALTKADVSGGEPQISGARSRSARTSTRLRGLGGWRPTRRALIGIAAVAVAVIAVVAAVFVVPLFAGAPDAQSPVQPPEAQVTEPVLNAAEPFVVHEDGETPAGLTWYTASAGEDNDWGVATYQNGFAEMPGIRLEDDAGTLRAQWSSPNWPSQFYAQLQEGTVDIEGLIDDGALVFDLSVESGSASSLRVSAHCTFPCAGSVDITDFVNDLEPDTTTQMTVPAVCFTRSGLDAEEVNTPFLLIGQGDIALTVDNIRWEPGSAKDPDAMTC